MSGGARAVVVGVAVVVALALFVAPLATPAAAQDFLDAYEAGVAAWEAGDAETTVDLMETAIAGRSEEANRLVQRFWFKPYLPHYYLGLARHRLGDCDGALEAWAESERQGVVQEQAEEWARLQELRARCRAERDRGREELAAILAAARTTIERAAALEESVAALAERPALEADWTRGAPGSPSLEERFAEAVDLLDQARSLVAAVEAEATESAEGDLAEARRLADQARLRFASVETDARQRIGAVEGRRTAAREDLTEAMEAARRALDALPTDRLSATVARRAEAVEAALAEAEALAADRPVAEAAAVRERLETATDRLRSAAAGPPTALREAARALLEGRPGEAVETLDGFTSRSRRARGHAHLLLSAARFALWVAGGETDAALLEQARQDAVDAREAQPDLAPPETWTSPRFRRFFTTATTPPGDDRPDDDGPG